MFGEERQRATWITARGKIPTKLNADKTRFDPRPVGALLTFCFRNCFRPLPVRYERTPLVPGCQYSLTRFLKIARRTYRSFVVLSRRTISARSVTTEGLRRAAAARQAPQRDLPMTCSSTAGERAAQRGCGFVETGVGLVGRLPSPRPGDQPRTEADQPATI
jgi:hypothetical protein